MACWEYGRDDSGGANRIRVMSGCHRANGGKSRILHGVFAVCCSGGSGGVEVSVDVDVSHPLNFVVSKDRKTIYKAMYGLTSRLKDEWDPLLKARV